MEEKGQVRKKGRKERDWNERQKQKEMIGKEVKGQKFSVKNKNIVA